jgi:hypothetical protein
VGFIGQISDETVQRSSTGETVADNEQNDRDEFEIATAEDVLSETRCLGRGEAMFRDRNSRTFYSAVSGTLGKHKTFITHKPII